MASSLSTLSLSDLSLGELLVALERLRDLLDACGMPLAAADIDTAMSRMRSYPASAVDQAGQVGRLAAALASDP